MSHVLRRRASKPQPVQPSAALAQWAAVFEPSVSRLTLVDLPRANREWNAVAAEDGTLRLGSEEPETAG